LSPGVRPKLVFWTCSVASVVGSFAEPAPTELTVSAHDKEIGIGHNQGPDFAPIPVEELDDVDDLIALLKEQGPVPPTDPTELTEGSQKAS